MGSPSIRDIVWEFIYSSNETKRHIIFQVVNLLIAVSTFQWQALH